MIAGTLRLLGRQGRWALPVGVVFGIVMPPLSTLLRPLLTLAVISTLAVTLARLDWQIIGTQLRRPAMPALLAALQLVASPLVVLAMTQLFGLAAAVSIALVLQSAAPPVGSAATFALMTGVAGERVLVVTVLSTLLLPATLTPLVMLALQQHGIQIEPVNFFLRVSLLVGAPLLVAFLVRRTVGINRLKANDDVMAGLNVVLLVVFAIAIMDGVAEFLVNETAAAMRLLALSFAMAIVLHLAAWLALRWHGHTTAMQAALCSGNRNMGLMLAITAGSAGTTASLYFGIAQIPMYCVPLILAPFVHANNSVRDQRR